MASFRRPSLRCLATCGANNFDWLRAWVNVKMRSIATPNDHIDMKKSTKATAFATIPIDCHIASKSTVHPPQKRLLIAKLQNADLLQCEVHRHRHDDRDRHAIEERRRELPLTNRVERCLIEQRNRAQHFRF